MARTRAERTWRRRLTTTLATTPPPVKCSACSPPPRRSLSPHDRKVIARRVHVPLASDQPDHGRPPPAPTRQSRPDPPRMHLGAAKVHQKLPVVLKLPPRTLGNICPNVMGMRPTRTVASLEPRPNRLGRCVAVAPWRDRWEHGRADGRRGVDRVLHLPELFGPS